MHTEDAWGNSRYLYQVRAAYPVTPPDIFTQLTHRLWRKMDKSGAGMDPHVWPRIFQVLQQNFRGRFSENPMCGILAGCRPGACTLCGRGGHLRPPGDGVLILTLEKPLTEFLAELADGLEAALGRGNGRVGSALVESFSDYLFVGPVCAECPMRQNEPQRAPWERDAAEPTWGGWREVEREEHVLL